MGIGRKGEVDGDGDGGRRRTYSFEFLADKRNLLEDLLGGRNITRQRNLEETSDPPRELHSTHLFEARCCRDDLLSKTTS